MDLGLSTDHIYFIKEQLHKYLEKDSKIWVFGSRSRGDFAEFSDLDLMLESDSDQKQKLFQIKEVFEESHLPIKIDLIQLKDFAKSYFENYKNERQLFIDL